MQLSEHFSLQEATYSSTAIRLGIANTPDGDTIARMVIAAQGMERVRSLLHNSIHIDSWFRDIRLNRAIGSKDTSDHIQGWAIDFICPGFGDPLEVCKTITSSSIEFSQIIWEGAWTHISFNPEKIRNREVLTATFVAGKAIYRKGLP